MVSLPADVFVEGRFRPPALTTTDRQDDGFSLLRDIGINLGWTDDF